MKRTPIQLADGRELIFFDAHQAPERKVTDTRSLHGQVTSGEVRRDLITDEWVTMATHRQVRTHLPVSTACPLCPSSGSNPTEIPAEDYEVVVFENRFPSFAGVSEPLPIDATAEEHPLFRCAPASGRCEVICFTADHDGSFANLSPERVRMIVDVWAQRTEALSRLPGVEQVFCFENRGKEIGVTLEHPHGQIYAYPFITPQSARIIASCKAYRERTGGDLFADILQAERGGERVVLTCPHWTAFVPYAARWPFELQILPHRHVSDFVELTDEERDELAGIYVDALGRFEAVCGTRAPYIAAWMQAPTRVGRDLARLHLRLFSNWRAPGKLKYLAGSEAAMGAYVNDVLPEVAATRLRAARGNDAST